MRGKAAEKPKTKWVWTLCGAGHEVVALHWSGLGDECPTCGGRVRKARSMNGMAECAGGWDPWHGNTVPSSGCGDSKETMKLFRERGWLRVDKRTGEERGYFTSNAQRKAALHELNARNTDGWRRDVTV